MELKTILTDMNYMIPFNLEKVIELFTHLRKK